MNPMKDSGVEWIGEIPVGWIVSRMRFLGSIKNGLTYSPDDLSDETGTLVLRSSNIQNGRLSFKDNVYVSKKVNSDLMMRKNDILITSRNGSSNLIGKNAIIEDEIIATYGAFMIVYRPNKKIIPKFLYYLMNSSFDFYRTFFTTSTINQLTAGIFNNMKVVYPSLQEQQAIANFLDAETKKLDDAKDLLQKQIEKLKEYRKSLIWETVTKGLDKSVPMKDSGVEWIGNIPSDWKLTRLKFITDGNLQYGANAEGVDYDENLPRYIRITDIDSNNNLKDSGKQSLSFNSAKPYILKKGDILFARSGATVGKTYLFQTDTLSAFAGYLIRYSPIENIESRFIYYMTLGSGYDNWKNSIFSQSTIQNIGADKYGNLPVVLPKDLEEQQAIADFLDEKTSIIENIISNIQSQIEVIDKQKKTLIYDYVTGKRRVI